MNHKLPCAIIRDLLPSYIEGLTEEETTQAVREHLDDCPDCMKQYAAMTADAEQPAADDAIEVDYLKSVRRHNHKHVLAAVLGTVIVLIAVLLTKTFVIGHEVSPQMLSYRTQLDGDTLVVTLENLNSSRAFSSVKYNENSNIITITPREVLASPLYSTGSHIYTTTIKPGTKVFLSGVLIFDSGLVIDASTAALYNAKTPYIGNASALGNLSGFLPLPQTPFTHELQTSAEPYGWTLNFKEKLTQKQQAQMQNAAPLMLALVGNAGEISWTCPDASGAVSRSTVTLADVNSRLTALTDAYNKQSGTNYSAKESVKDYAASPADLQLLINLLSA